MVVVLIAHSVGKPHMFHNLVTSTAAASIFDGSRSLRNGMNSLLPVNDSVVEFSPWPIGKQSVINITDIERIIDIGPLLIRA